MPHEDWFIPMVVGGVFILIGLVGVFWGRLEEKRFNDSLSRRRGDLREFMEHWPPRPQPGAPKIGGWIALAVGLLILILGGAFLLWG